MTLKAKPSALALLAILAACGKPPPQQQPQPDPKLEDQTRLLELQKMCADQAAKAFHSADYPRKANVINTYINHYSAKSGRCFMLVNIYDTSKNLPSSFEALDAFEGRRLGSFFAQTETDAKAADQIVTCDEKPLGRPQKACSSKKEWDAYKALYMDAPQPEPYPGAPPVNRFLF